ncbi:type IV pilus modification protein PilV [Pseudomonas solani]|uniref:type IV pilus modification protein PilV n=1 Tax=Pseudomonas TaxID=286 RepID=UPI002305567F|nr:type IV pilus modification protein PilV [Pseudomonas sp. TUM22785]WCD81516.1 type IV pilus modification protein PilV [Pseudomonas sp. TUM22785]
MRSFSVKQLGTSLIEVLVTLVIFTVGLLGLAALQLNALQGTSDSAQRSQATSVLQDLAERIRANPAGSAADYAAAVNCAQLPATICSDYFSPSTNAKVNATSCTATQMAKFDSWEASCSYAAISTFNTIDARFNSRDFISPASTASVMTITNASNVLSLKSSWLSKSNAPQEQGKETRSEKVLSAELKELRR